MERKKIILKNVSLGVLCKFFNMVIVFTTIPILLNYLEEEEYGIWVTIFSIINIVLFIDGGIGNGLKTKLTESLSLNKFNLAKTFISTAYISISLISFILFCIGAFLIFNINLNDLLNTTILPNSELQKVLFLTLILVLSGFVLNLYKSFYYAKQQSSKVEFALLIYQILILITITILLNFFQRSLFYVALMYGISNLIIGVFFTGFFFRKNKKIIPSIKFFSKEKVKDLMGLSLAFFIIQLCMIVIFTSDNLMIAKLIGPKEVASYDVVYKLFQVIITLTVITIDPFWALFSDAFQKKDFIWIKKTIIRLNKIFLFFILLIVIFYFSSEFIIKLWLKRDINISNNLIFFMAIFVLIRVYGIIYMTFLNGIGKVKLQMYLYIFGAIINVPLSIYFVNYLNLGSSGVILGTILSVLGLSIILPIETYKILKNKLQ